MCPAEPPATASVFAVDAAFAESFWDCERTELPMIAVGGGAPPAARNNAAAGATDAEAVEKKEAFVRAALGGPADCDRTINSWL